MAKRNDERFGYFWFGLLSGVALTSIVVWVWPGNDGNILSLVRVIEKKQSDLLARLPDYVATRDVLDAIDRSESRMIDAAGANSRSSASAPEAKAEARFVWRASVICINCKTPIEFGGVKKGEQFPTEDDCMETSKQVVSYLMVGAAFMKSDLQFKNVCTRITLD